MIKELCNYMKKSIIKKFWKVLVGVLSCCMLLNGCGTVKDAPISWQLEEEETTMELETSTVENREAEDTQECMIYVYICGAVVNPGVYQVTEGSRLFEAIDAAGGMLDEADLASQNLARVVQDGEQIQIWTKEEMEEQKKSGIAMDTANITECKGLVNINTASVQELTTLTGIGESRAQAIVKYRETNGLFKSIDGIKKVTGIKEGLFERIRDQITI